MEEGSKLVEFLQNNWELCFLYGLKTLDNISKSLSDLKIIVAVHDKEISELKKEKKKGN